MKIAVRALALCIVLTGLTAGAISKRSSTGIQVVPTAAPMPTCPLDDPDGCGINKF